LISYYIDIGRSELSNPPGRRAAAFPPITDVLVNAAELEREFAKIAPKANAKDVDGYIAWLTPGALPVKRPSGPLALKRTTQSRTICTPTPPIRAASGREPPS
jgi:hypothetical protein